MSYFRIIAPLFLLASLLSLYSCVTESKQAATGTPVDTTILHSFTSVHVTLNGNFRTAVIGQPQNTYSESIIDCGSTKITWTGLNFKGTYSNSTHQSSPHGSSGNYDTEDQTYDNFVSGILGISGDMIESASSTSTYEDDVNVTLLRNQLKTFKRIDFNSVSLLSQSNDSLIYSSSGSSLQSNISSILDSSYNSNSNMSTTLNTISWDQQPSAVLTVAFYK
jgi:hypothetical protein